MSTQFASLSAYGADVAGALERFVGDEELYEQCLEEFRDDACWDDLAAALSAHDTKAAFVAAHTLKGVAANLGLTPLYDALSRVVEPLRTNSLEGIEMPYSALEEARRRCPLQVANSADQSVW